MQKYIILILMVSLVIQGCSLKSDMTEVNQLISQANTERFKAFAEGMTGCGDNAACQVGLSMAFSANLGQQAFYKPETTSDLLKAALPYTSVVADLVRIWHYSSGDGDSNGGFIVTGDNNQFIGVGNKLSADNESSIDSTLATISAQTSEEAMEGETVEGAEEGTIEESTEVE